MFIEIHRLVNDQRDTILDQQDEINRLMGLLASECELKVTAQRENITCQRAYSRLLHINKELAEKNERLEERDRSWRRHNGEL